MNPRRLLLELFDAALRAVDGNECVREVLRHLGPGPVALFAVGKAASAMTRGAQAALGDRIQQGAGHHEGRARGSRRRAAPNLHVIESAHPVPGRSQPARGRRNREAHRRAGRGRVSGLPVVRWQFQPRRTHARWRPLEQLRELNQRGLAAGWDIARLQQRARAAVAPQGRWRRAVCSAAVQAHALFISDVPGDDPAVIGSGLLGGQAGIVDHVLRIVVANVDVATRQAADLAASLEGAESREKRLRAFRVMQPGSRAILSRPCVRPKRMAWCGVVNPP